ncbi:hypothetical protein OAO94_03680, partial [Flavobacteriaceae bacterium]|nr:hypothetical protein [Flavobacteriaceae bacterium]
MKISHNDNMYFTTLFNSCISYECNGFVQMPYYFILKVFIPVFNLLNVDHYLGFKLLSIIIFISSITLLFNKTKNFLYLILIISLNPILLSGPTEVGNYTYTYFFLIYSFYLIIEKQRYLLSGIILGISIGFKISSILFLPVLLMYCSKHLKLFLIGLIISLIPLGFWINDYFFINNFQFHSFWTPTFRNNHISYFDIQSMFKVL